MQEKQESIRNEVIQKLLNYINKNVSEDNPDKSKLISLTPIFFRTIPIEDFTSRSISDLAGIIMTYFNFMTQRKPHECKLRVFNPDQKIHQWQSTHTIIELSYDDMPFLVDSMRIELDRLGYTLHLIVSAGGLKVERNADGDLVDFPPTEAPLHHGNIVHEAIAHIEIDRETDPKALTSIQENLYQVLKDVTIVVRDWLKMRDKMQEVIQELEQLNKVSTALDHHEIQESIAFLKWIVDNRFTFLGFRAYELVGTVEEGVDIEESAALKLISNSGLGVVSDESSSKIIRYFHELPPKARKMALSDKILIIAKTNTKATVHRRSYTDLLVIKRFNQKGEFIGEYRFIGLYTSEAYNTDPQIIPVLRDKISMVLKKSALPTHGHGARALRNILSNLPRDDLFQANIDELYELAMGILNLQERRRIRLFVRKDAYNRYYSCLVYVPRENFNTDLLYKMRDLLCHTFQGEEVTFTTQFFESILARIHFVVRVNPKHHITYHLKEVENQLIEIGRSWYDDLRENLLLYFGEEQGNDLMKRYTRAFPAGYRETFNSQEAIYDIEYIEKLKTPLDLQMSFYRSSDKTLSHNLSFKLFHLDSTVPLSDALPMLENMGLRVIGEQPYEIIFQDGSSVWINNFIMEYSSDKQLNVEDYKELFQNAFYKIWRGEVENDGFNRLVLKARLNWHEVCMFRAYAKYLKQTGFRFSQQYIEETLINNADVAMLLVKLFKFLFDPEQANNISPDAIANLETEIKNALDLVANLDQDRILRRYWEVIKATLRTNFFQYEIINDVPQPKLYLSFKFDSSKIPELPLPLPMYEIFVYSSLFEGVHLRAGKVARGGIRWSDRKEDFRTEVLGLMKAQRVKNALIVPAGAKGGFVLKDASSEGNTIAGAIECYKKFIYGLLDITDNLAGNKVIHPKDVVRYDENDPYLVVAADKGTATFSDIANSIAKEYHFWLGDAFASGGSTGYDHKKMAITSRGAWESVKHHFQLIGIDIHQPFTVVGIGDMSGDVFGNGMLLSNQIKLIAAFNHMHIFIDPNPDPEISYNERSRLFHLPRSSWEDYNKDLLSPGGGIYKRSAKSIQISPEIQSILKIEQTTLEPNELIKAILKAPVDLLWNGGIGTYVKSSLENDLEVGDRANDAIRINGSELRCHVVGEGGNLGCTQLGRIEYELMNAGKINTDFIDNSAGVDCSDHEVNIKILLNECVNSKEMTEEERNLLLSEMREEVAKLVLQDNYRQVRTITRESIQCFDSLGLYIRYLDDQENSGKINRKIEFLPSKSTLLDRKAAGKGLTRPEIAVLMAYNKIIIKEEILSSSLLEQDSFDKFIAMAFPQELNEKFKQQLKTHRLKNEIIATQLSNVIVNEMGIVFVYQMMDETGAQAADVVHAYVVMRELFDMPWLLKAIDEIVDKNKNLQLTKLELEMTLEAMRLTRRGVRWLLRNQGPPYNITETIHNYSAYVNELYKKLPHLLIGSEKEDYEIQMENLIVAGVPKDVALKVASARYIYSALNIVLIATKHKADINHVATIYFILAERLGLSWFREKINAYPVDDRWSVLARSSFKDELDVEQRALTICALRWINEDTKNLNASIDQWLKQHQNLLTRWEMVLTQLRNATIIDSAMLTVAIRTLWELVAVSEKLSGVGDAHHA